MLTAIPWLLLVDALVGVSLFVPRSRVCLVRLLTGGLLLGALPGRVSQPLGLGLLALVLLATALPLVSVVFKIPEHRDNHCLSHPCLLLTALVVTHNRLVVLLVGLWALWLTAALLRNEDLAVWFSAVLVCVALVVLVPLLVVLWALQRLVYFECTRKPRTRPRPWPGRPQELPPRLRWTPLLALLLPLLLEPPEGIGVTLVFWLVAALFPVSAFAARLARVAVVLGWFLHGWSGELSSALSWGSSLLSLAALGVVPLALARQIRLMARTRRSLTWIEAERYFECNNLLLESVVWALAVWLIGGPAGLSLALTLLGVSVAFSSTASSP